MHIWVGRFFEFLDNNKNISKNNRFDIFIQYLEKLENVKEWQIKQAKKAVYAYRNYIISKKADEPSQTDIIIDSLQKALRVKHYSYKTECLYIAWVKRFFNYLVKIKEKSVFMKNLNSEDIKDYLTYLAINQKVSSSTQNQAFNALLFL